MKLKLVLFMALVLSLSGCGFLPEEEGELVPPIITPEQIPFRTIEIERQNIENRVNVRGYITPSIIENYFYEEKGGRLKSINVRVGQFVEKGDPLIELIVDNLPNTIEYQKLTLESLQIDLDATRTIQKLEMTKEELALDKQKADYEQMVTHSSIYTKRELEDAKSALEFAEMNHGILAATHNKILQQKENTIATEKLRLENYEKTMNNSIITASMDGVVTYVKRAFIGDIMNDYDTLISVADISVVQIQYEGNSAYDFALGMPVEIMYKGATYTGSVIQTPDSVPTEEKEFFVNTVIFEIDEVPANYIVGDAFDVTALLDYKENVVVLPKDAVKKFGSDEIVYVLENGEKRERYVEVGIDNGPYVEILNGLEQGDLVIIN